MANESNTYETRDLPIASALKASGASVIRITRDEKGRGHWVFADFSKCQQIVMEYMANELTLDAKTLMGAQRDLKTLLNESGGRND